MNENPENTTRIIATAKKKLLINLMFVLLILCVSKSVDLKNWTSYIHIFTFAIVLIVVKCSGYIKLQNPAGSISRGAAWVGLFVFLVYLIWTYIPQRYVPFRGNPSNRYWEWLLLGLAVVVVRLFRWFSKSRSKTLEPIKKDFVDPEKLSNEHGVKSSPFSLPELKNSEFGGMTRSSTKDK